MIGILTPAPPTHFIYTFSFLITAVETINGTALSGVDFDAKNESITLSSVENTTLEINSREDEICKLDEKYFQIAVYDQNGALVSSTANITINSDTECGKPF